jgi:ABC-type nickel/cobalt efflux system permease component RcnA
LLLRGVLPLDRISSWSERLVGVVLIGIGLWGLQKALRRRAHVHEHEHDGERHAHLHLHRHPHEVAAAAAEPAQPRPATPIAATAHAHTHAALGVGVLHGLAGSSHFLGVLPALALPTHAGAAAYILGFGIGTVAAMTLYATCVGALAQRTARRAAGAYRILLASCAGAAIVVGCFWLASGH